MKFKWFFNLINLCAVALIAVSIFVLMTVVMTPAGQVPQVMGFSILQVLTGSMEPAIPEGSMLLIRQADPYTLEKGDIISFYSPDPSLDGALNTHRIVGVETSDEGLRFITKGDANFLEDQQPVNAGDVVGKVIYSSPALGKLVRLVSNPLVFGLAILLPLLAMLIGNLVKALRTAAALARQEEEAAVRQALEALKARSEIKKDTDGK